MTSLLEDMGEIGVSDPEIYHMIVDWYGFFFIAQLTGDWTGLTSDQQEKTIRLYQNQLAGITETMPEQLYWICMVGNYFVSANIRIPSLWNEAWYDFSRFAKIEKGFKVPYLYNKVSNWKAVKRIPRALTSLIFRYLITVKRQPLWKKIQSDQLRLRTHPIMRSSVMLSGKNLADDCSVLGLVRPGTFLSRPDLSVILSD